MNELMFERLKMLARSECYYDVNNVLGPILDAYAGGDIDDAFYIGEHSGEVMLARQVLTALDIKWTEE